MRPIARGGDSLYLLETSPSYGVVAYLKDGSLHIVCPKPKRIGSIAKMGYWHELSDPEKEELQAIVDKAGD